MEPKNHIEKENHLSNLHDFGFKLLIFQGVFVPKIRPRFGVEHPVFVKHVVIFSIT